MQTFRFRLHHSNASLPQHRLVCYFCSPKVEELEAIAVAVTNHYIALDRESGRAPRKVLSQFEHKVPRLSADLKIPSPIVSKAFIDAWNRRMKRS